MGPWERGGSVWESEWLGVIGTLSHTRTHTHTHTYTHTHIHSHIHTHTHSLTHTKPSPMYIYHIGILYS